MSGIALADRNRESKMQNQLCIHLACFTVTSKDKQDAMNYRPASLLICTIYGLSLLSKLEAWKVASWKAEQQQHHIIKEEQAKFQKGRKHFH